MWTSVKDELPSDFDENGKTKHYLVYIDNPFFKDGNYHISYLQRTNWVSGKYYYKWQGIEPNVHHVDVDNQPNVTHWSQLQPPSK